MTAAATAIQPEELLDLADQVLTARVRGVGSLWPRVCALLIRLALERSLDRYWARVLPEAAQCGMRQQLLLLPWYTRSSSEAADATEVADATDAASLAREAWLGLAGASHHHAYELAPTAQELRRWHAAVSRLTAILATP
jgi:sugar phosphate isomerase/epimerase